jgi:hypothetical protein
VLKIEITWAVGTTVNKTCEKSKEFFHFISHHTKSHSQTPNDWNCNMISIAGENICYGSEYGSWKYQCISVMDCGITAALCLWYRRVIFVSEIYNKQQVINQLHMKVFIYGSLIVIVMDFQEANINISMIYQRIHF